MRRLALIAMLGLMVTGVLAPMVPRAEAQLSAGQGSPGTAAGEFRALWVDAYHDGAKTKEQIDRLVADARRANMNALIVQVRRRGDAYYAKSLEPRTEDPALAPGFDPLAYLIEKAHTGSPRLEVHAWIIALLVWGDQDRPPRDPSHVFNRHGPNAPGRESWLMRREDGQTWTTGYFLDPGHPDAARYTVDVALNLVRSYDVDGLHLDYIRYPADSAVGGVPGRRWGYNEVSVARFNARYGRTGRPDPQDPQWGQWRRDQVTALVRRIYLGTGVVKPHVKVSAAVIPWGDGPKSDADWTRTAAYAAVFQDWRSWLEEGILDLAMPMNYYRESQSPQGAWFDRWVAWQRDHAYGRQIVPGVGTYLNDPGEGISQMRRALAPGPNGVRAAGVAIYSYAVSNRTLENEDPADDVRNGDVWAALVTPGPLNGGHPPFASPVPVPPMAWKADPTSGAILLRVPGLDGARVDLSGPAGFGGETDGDGIYALALAPPGRYALTVRHRTLAEPRVGEIEVALGAVAELELR